MQFGLVFDNVLWSELLVSLFMTITFIIDEQQLEQGA